MPRVTIKRFTLLIILNSDTLQQRRGFRKFGERGRKLKFSDRQLNIFDSKISIKKHQELSL